MGTYPGGLDRGRVIRPEEVARRGVKTVEVIPARDGYLLLPVHADQGGAPLAVLFTSKVSRSRLVEPLHLSSRRVER